jgi:PhoH-like ATPase
MSTFPKRKVVIVTKDTGLRVRANTWGCIAENYKHDLLNESQLFTGYRIVEVLEASDWEYLNKREHFHADKLVCKDQLDNLAPNEFICFKFGNHSVLGWNRYDGFVYFNDKKQKDSFMGISAKNMEQKFALEILSDDQIPLVCLSGPAGSGKSLLTLAVALEKINIGEYDRLIVMKPLIPVGGKDIGFLPGSKLEKISAWLGPIKDNLIQLTNFGSSRKGEGKFGGICFEEMVEDGIIEVEALTFIQGRSIPNALIMLDECENVSPKEARMVVERCGKGSKVVLLGDLSQIENPYLDKHSCGLAHAINGGKTHEVAGSVAMTKVERSILASAASKIFKVR